MNFVVKDVKNSTRAGNNPSFIFISIDNKYMYMYNVVSNTYISNKVLRMNILTEKKVIPLRVQKKPC